MSPGHDQKGPDFVIKRTVTPSEAISLLVERFPFMDTLGESQEELAATGPFYAYGLFATHIQPQLRDIAVLQATTQFIDELAESNDPLLEELLVIEIFEKLAGNPATAAVIRARIGQRAQEMLKRVENDFFGSR